MKIILIVGGRPQFVKASVVSDAVRKAGYEEVIVHTGQHYDYNMSQEFFDELGIPEPKYNLGISGGTHGDMTGRMLIEIEKVLLKEKPDWVIVFGDMNSTLAGALATVKLHIPLCHVEAGGRCHVMTNPEEVNRICTDHVSTLLMAVSEHDMDELHREGLSERAFFVGNTMYDAFEKFSNRLPIEKVKLTTLDGAAENVPENYYYMTCHREENTAVDDTLREILTAMNSLEFKTIYPVHPRNKERAKRLQAQYNFDNVIMCEPVGYLESTSLMKHCKKVVTDSGGLQTEAFFAGKKCVTVLDFVTWPEIMVNGCNEMASPKADDILEKIFLPMTVDPAYKPFGDGHAAEKIVQEITKYSVEKGILTT